MAKATAMQLGKYNKHVNESYGPDNNIMKFYITEYSSHLGRDSFKPRFGEHTGTGYKSNLRPQIYYSRKLDELDNPVMGKLVSDNYHSVTDKQYRPYAGLTGKEPLPIDTFIQSNAFVNENHRTTPSFQEANSVFVKDPTQLHRKPLALTALKNKDPIAFENDNTGPSLYSTEHHTHYQQKNPHVDSTYKTVGPKEDSGFTISKNLEPITFRPEDPHDGQYPGWYTDRPTGVSMMKTHYLPNVHAKGGEKLQQLAPNAERDTGFTRYILPTAAHTAAKDKVYTKLSDVKDPAVLQKTKRSDPAEYANMEYPQRFPSLHRTTYQGKQLHEPTDKLNKINIGYKEDSGYVENNKSYTLQPHGQYDTHYLNEYKDKNHPLKTLYGKLNDESIRVPQADGYTKSEKLHTNGKDADIAKQLQGLHPYVNRSLKARDPFYAEKMYENKRRDPIIG